MVTSRETPTPANTAGGRIGEGEYADAVAEQTRGLWDVSALVLHSLAGTADALTASVTPALDTVPLAGMAFWLRPILNNTTAVTLNIDGEGSFPVVSSAGNPLVADSLVAGTVYLLLFDGSQFVVVTASTGSSGGGSGTVDLQTFTSNGTWTKPAQGTVALIRCWGAGGSGGRAGVNDGGGGGGGGAYVERLMPLTSLASTVAITIGAGGAVRTVDNTTGAAGGNTTFGSHVTAFGGGGGNGDQSTSGGGGGGGSLSAGATATAAGTGGNGGTPRSGILTSAGDSISALPGVGGAVNPNTPGSANDRGGGGGGFGSIGTTGGPGGDSVYGGAGGAGGTDNSGGTAAVGGNSIYGGAGGGGGSSITSASSGGTSLFGGNGGNGAFGANNATAGAQPGGGGGGSSQGNSGAGGDGQCIVLVW